MKYSTYPPFSSLYSHNGENASKELPRQFYNKIFINWNSLEVAELGRNASLV